MELLIERPRLREFVVEDHEAVHRYASDPEATRYTDWGPNNLKATEVFMAGAQASASDVPRTRHAGAIVRQDLRAHAVSRASDHQPGDWLRRARLRPRPS